MATASSSLILTKKVVKDSCCVLFADYLFLTECVIVSHFLWYDVIFRTDKNGPLGLKPGVINAWLVYQFQSKIVEIYGLNGAVASRPHSRQQ